MSHYWDPVGYQVNGANGVRQRGSQKYSGYPWCAGVSEDQAVHTQLPRQDLSYLGYAGLQRRPTRAD